MNIWKDVNPKRINPDDFLAYIEIGKGMKNKYELDKETGRLILDRVLYTATHYPTNYGFIPHTLSEDHDPLDVLVLCSEQIMPGSLVRCYPIGVMRMIDQKEMDEKVIAIPFGDPMYNTYKDISELPTHIADEIQHFFMHYKSLEHKEVTVDCVLGAEEAKKSIVQALEAYTKEFGVDTRWD